ncbi:TetR/AcrR family transcriptional regulator [Actinokineospora guangxiensis]|uniref:TetR/AcrR family transcriptional regulator n=1 Tax=Actinokineospora guangxiensis TaxID=1490288 RepID=A0ABW0EQI2_9PSEU
MTERTYAGVSLAERRQQRRGRLLAAALAVFTSTGYQQAKVSEVCAEAGVSTRSFYELFTGKEAVLLALHDLINQLAYDRVSAALAELPETGIGTRVDTLMDVFVGAVTSDPRLPRLNYVEAVGVSPELEQQHRLWVQRWSSLIEREADRAVADGHAPARDYHLTAIALVGAITGLLREWQARAYPVEDVATEIKALMIAAITRP